MSIICRSRRLNVVALKAGAAFHVPLDLAARPTASLIVSDAAATAVLTLSYLRPYPRRSGR
jgi:hypothetical protein